MQQSFKKQSVTTATPGAMAGLALFAATGLIAGVWIADEFDAVRLWLLSFFAVPTFTLWILANIYYRTPLMEFPQSTRVVLLLALSCFAWGHFLFLNTLSDVTERHNTSINFGPATMNITQYRGAFGHLYYLRW